MFGEIMDTEWIWCNQYVICQSFSFVCKFIPLAVLEISQTF